MRKRHLADRATMAQPLDIPQQILSEIQALSPGKRQAVWAFIQEIKKAPKKALASQEKADVRRRGVEFREVYPDIPLKGDLLQWVGGVPNDGKSLGDIILDRYNSEASEL